MEIISPYLITILIAWLGAHIVKYIIGLIKGEKYGFRSHIFTSGGMPSSHSTTVMALATIIGFKDGLDSGIFSMAVLFALIVMYDAMKVRRSSGEQGAAIHALIKEQNSKVKLPRAAKGHTPLEVFIGACFGSLIGIVVYLTTT